MAVVAIGACENTQVLVVSLVLSPLSQSGGRRSCSVGRSQLGFVGMRLEHQPRSTAYDHLITRARPFFDKDIVNLNKKTSPNGKPLRFTSADAVHLCHKHRSEPRNRVDGMEPQPRFPSVGCMTRATGRPSFKPNLELSIVLYPTYHGSQANWQPTHTHR